MTTPDLDALKAALRSVSVINGHFRTALFAANAIEALEADNAWLAGIEALKKETDQ